MVIALECDEDEQLADAFREHCATARTDLEALMGAAGFLPRDGWRISESLRRVGELRLELVLRPVHPTLFAPGSMECVVTVDGGRRRAVEARCTPDAAPSPLPP